MVYKEFLKSGDYRVLGCDAMYFDRWMVTNVSKEFSASSFCFEDESRRFLQNVGTRLPNFIVSHPRRQ
jgi:hypothetical protein